MRPFGFADGFLSSFIICGCVCLLYVVTKEEPRKPTVKRVEVCSPRSVDAYSPTELIRIAQERRRQERIK